MASQLPSNENHSLLPAVENLEIVGDAVPGNMIQACGFLANNARACNFEWVRQAEDGSTYYIEGANSPEYTVTIDDVDTILAVECVPIDDKNRKGKRVKAYASNQKKIGRGMMKTEALELEQSEGLELKESVAN
eukprot:TRINITY_DN8660_c0_g1_i1.p1 TRINITY_DN8660_c0_g1~~TRINITY_DN8660_c0_g1_i1.p1  ORF type:complete len:134 (-),score=27.65 TRINITY_DN8660_c0_g1_i1:322-723(-)